MDLRQFCQGIAKVDIQAGLEAQRRLDAKTKPRRSLGALEDLACRLAAIYRTPEPPLPRPGVVVMAGDHGVAAEGVSAYPQEVTVQMIDNFVAGGAACNVLARQLGARLLVVDMGSKRGSGPAGTAQAGGGSLVEHRLGPGTNNFVRGPAMSPELCQAAIETGIDVACGLYREKCDLIVIGDMGIANTTSASALTAALAGVEAQEVTGRGTGIDDARLGHKLDIIRRAININRLRAGDPLDVLAKLGGFEIAGLAGVILGAGSVGVPVVLDGFITAAAALAAAALCPQVKDYCIAGHGSAEPGHQVILRRLELRPLLTLDMRLGEATGAMLAVPLILSSLRILKEMATFAAAGVTDSGA